MSIAEQQRKEKWQTKMIMDKDGDTTMVVVLPEYSKQVGGGRLPPIHHQALDKKEEVVTVVYNAKFPFLNMEMFWDKNGEMRASIHCPTTFKSIANGVFTRIARLNPNTATNQNLQIDELYPDHAEALFTTNFAPPVDFPIFKTLWEEDDQWKNQPKN
eukprot:6677604-Ditylum_brightwellii.AAC.1